MLSLGQLAAGGPPPGEEEGVLNPLDIISKTQVDTVPPSQELGWTHGTSD